MLSQLNAIPKVKLLHMLYTSNPEFCSYLYSCFKNSEKRWCGECGKCKRIWAFWEAIGIPRNHIGMPHQMDISEETGEITKKYWQNLSDYLSDKRQNK
jgi:hypothetical protein